MIRKKNYGFIYILIEIISIHYGEQMMVNNILRKLKKRKKFNDKFKDNLILIY